MGLNDTTIKNTKPRDKAYKLSDGGGLVLLINSNGSKWWRFRYRVDGKEKMLSFGVYPDVSLKRARERRDEARQQVANNVDPSAVRRDDKAARADTFEGIAREWFAKHSKDWAKSHSVKVLARLENDIFPWLGSRGIRKIAASELLNTLRRIETRGALDAAHRCHQDCGRVFRYAIATGRAERDVSADLRGALPPARGKHFATITEPKKIGALLRAIDSYDGSVVVRTALRFLPLIFVRPGELRGAEWSEIDFDAKEWRIRAERMKMRVLHIVPLSRQAIEVLKDIKPITGDGRFVFPGAWGGGRPISDNALTAALRRMGYEQGAMTVHGFRAMASTLLNESQKWHRDAIERQLAHSERDEVRGAYNYAEHLPERRKMMQAWSDYLDGLRLGDTVVPIRAKTA